ncbi:MAG: hypothetical protein AVDCRST_MAG59-1199 [uncultured Thermomicrobiales bacterium]|uniref:Uncharacterized protein n=1 Tax=uncultured Thermomicrobiales bacterium TaxID=1645740 RepID=A0A6J4UA01_9BACT|nr:MAG: hypothetical protein AVDCRST_MAG59-1199 [uncultured Thermomicrobiales bacterium]
MLARSPGCRLGVRSAQRGDPLRGLLRLACTLLYLRFLSTGEGG